MNDGNYNYQSTFYPSSSTYDFNKQQQDQNYEQYWSNYYYCLQHPQFAQNYMYYYSQDQPQQKQKNLLQIHQSSTWMSDPSTISSPRTPNFISNSSEFQKTRMQEEESENVVKHSSTHRSELSINKRNSTKSLKKETQAGKLSSTSSRRSKFKKGGVNVRRVGRPRKDERRNQKVVVSQDIGVENMVFQQYGERKIKALEVKEIQIPGVKILLDFGNDEDDDDDDAGELLRSSQRNCQENNFLLNVQNCQEIKEVQPQQQQQEENTDDQAYQERHIRCFKSELCRLKRDVVVPKIQTSLKRKKYSTSPTSIIKICLNQEKVIFE